MKLLLPMLKEAHKRYGYLSEKILKEISEKAGIPISHVYGVASFYSLLHTKKQGKNVIYVCQSPSCHVNGSTNIIKILEKLTKARVGKTSKDKKFSLYLTSCIGCCDEAPAMLMNGKAYTKLNEEKLNKIIKKCRS